MVTFHPPSSLYFYSRLLHVCVCVCTAASGFKSRADTSRSADIFSQNPKRAQEAILMNVLGEISEHIEPILKSVDEVSVIILVKFCKFHSSC